MIALIKVLGELALEGMRMLPDYEQRMEEEFNERLNEYITEIECEHPDTARIDELRGWFESYGKSARK